MEKIDDIPVKLNFTEIRESLHLPNRKEEWSHAKRLLEVAQSLITARAFYKVSNIESKNDDGISIEGIRLKSRVIRKHLDKVGLVFHVCSRSGINSKKMLERARI